jgi:hypothetical protein
MEKSYRIYVTNIDQAMAALKAFGIEARAIGTYIHFMIEESRKMDVILHLNKEKIVVYDIEEI